MKVPFDTNAALGLLFAAALASCEKEAIEPPTRDIAAVQTVGGHDDATPESYTASRVGFESAADLSTGVTRVKDPKGYTARRETIPAAQLQSTTGVASADPKGYTTRRETIPAAQLLSSTGGSSADPKGYIARRENVVGDER